jgi:hypothetical protein
MFHLYSSHKHNCKWLEQVLLLDPFDYQKSAPFAELLCNMGLCNSFDWSVKCYDEYITSSALSLYSKEFVNAKLLQQMVHSYLSIFSFAQLINLANDDVLISIESLKFHVIQLYAREPISIPTIVDLSNVDQCSNLCLYLQNMLTYELS